MSLKQAAEAVRAAGRGKDTELVHLTRNEVAGLHALAKAAGGALTRNPDTGMPEAGFLDSILPTLLGAGAMFIPGMQPLGAAAIGAATGAMTNKQDPLMGAILGGMGGYGGAGLASGLQGAGIGAAQQAAIDAAAQGAGEAAIGQGLQASTVAPGLGLNPAVAPSAVQSTVQGATNQAAADATKAFMEKPFYEQASAGLQAAVNNPGQFIEGMGGTMPALKTTGMAAAPMLYGQMFPGANSGLDFGGDGEASEYNYDAGFTGGETTGDDPSSERRWFNPTFTRMAEGGTAAPKYTFDAQSQRFSPAPQGAAPATHPLAGLVGGVGAFKRMSPGVRSGFIKQLSDRLHSRGAAPKYSFDADTQQFTRMAAGGEVALSEGGFVIPADVVSMLGNGSSAAGLEALAQHLGATPIDGPGDGQSDSIPASIDGVHPAAVARQEAYLTPEQVQAAGGEDKLYKLLERVRKAAHGKAQQQRPVDPEQVLA